MKIGNGFKIASAYVGTVLGAGFASGQEIGYFFSLYGRDGIKGIILATLLFSFAGCWILNRVFKHNVKNIRQMLLPVFGKTLTDLFEVFVYLFLFIGFCVMLAGSGAVFSEYLFKSYWLGVLVMATATAAVLSFGLKGLLETNTVLVPSILLFSIGLCLFSLRITPLNQGLSDLMLPNKINWVVSALLYVSYNLITASVILCSMYEFTKNFLDVLKGGIFGGMTLGAVSLIINFAIQNQGEALYRYQAPMMYIALSLGSKAGLFYGILLWMAMFTTAIACAYGVCSKTAEIYKISFRKIIILFSATALPFTQYGFKGLLRFFYPFFGYMGLIFVFLFLFKRFLQKLKELNII